MGLFEDLGSVGHRGGVVVTDPALTIGIVQIVVRTSGVQVELITRRPLDRRGADERREAIRTRNGTWVVAERRLLPEHDEGEDLRLAWLDSSGHPHWEYPIHSTGSGGDDADGEFGPSMQSTYLLPTHYQMIDLVFAWPEIGFPETIVTVPLPDQRTVERQTVSVWDAALAPSNAPSWQISTAASTPQGQVRDETGSNIASPQVLLRTGDAVLILARLSAHEDVLRATLTGLARRADGEAIRARAFPDRLPSGWALDIAARRGTPMLGLIGGNTLHLGQLSDGETTGGPGRYETTSTWTLAKPATASPVRLGVAWPVAGLDDAEITVDLDLLG